MSVVVILDKNRRQAMKIYTLHSGGYLCGRGVKNKKGTRDQRGHWEDTWECFIYHGGIMKINSMDKIDRLRGWFKAQCPGCVSQSDGP